ncbi:hypothetical protein AALP_AA7G155600, partial [Arabis alpina]
IVSTRNPIRNMDS